MKHILTVQDLSCVGRCSLTVALPVLSAMGIHTSVLPTAVLSTHTAFPKPEVVDLTAQLLPFAEHWSGQNVTFDAISVGYLSDPRQAEIIGTVCDRFGCDMILDPVMGDNGKLYSRITPAHVDAMRSLCRRARIVLPNVTEAAALAGLPYRETPDEAYLSSLAEKLLALGAKAVVITGIRWDEASIGWFYSNGTDTCVYKDSYVNRSFHGTGDLFAAVFAGACLQGANVPAAAERAARFVRRCVENTREATPFGVEFERELPSLWA